MRTHPEVILFWITVISERKCKLLLLLISPISLPQCFKTTTKKFNYFVTNTACHIARFFWHRREATGNSPRSMSNICLPPLKQWPLREWTGRGRRSWWTRKSRGNAIVPAAFYALTHRRNHPETVKISFKLKCVKQEFITFSHTLPGCIGHMFGLDWLSLVLYWI